MSDPHPLPNIPDYPQHSVFIFANYRSGSSLLSLALRDTGIAGRPNEYFYPKIRERQATAWKINPDDFPKYLTQVIKFCTGPNRVFGTKIMYPDLMRLVAELENLLPENPYTSEIDLLTHFFPQQRYLYIYRQDKVRQAISALRAIQTKLNHLHTDAPEERAAKLQENLQYNPQRLAHHLLIDIVENEYRWQQFFEKYDLNPLTIRYETFTADYENTLRRVLETLDLPDTENAVIGEPPLQKLADEITDEWYERFVTEQPWLLDDHIQEQFATGHYDNVEEFRERLQAARGSYRAAPATPTNTVVAAPTNVPKRSLFVCSTPHAGDDLLVRGLNATDVVNTVDRYLADDLRPTFEEQQGTTYETYRDYLEAVLATQTGDGVFTATVQYPHMHETTAHLRQMMNKPNTSFYHMAERVFGDVRYVRVVRRDKVRQAIAVARASGQTVYDEASIVEHLVALIDDEQSWTLYFQRYGIEALTVTGEAFSKNRATLARAVSDILAHGEIEAAAPELVDDLPADPMADAITDEWHARFI
ncbi:MAG: Stf0 family sulfotransferase, partial [Chloroflexota bacterium]